MSEPFADLERRACAEECRVDLAEDRKIRGYAIVFNKPSLNLGGFREVVRPEAVDRTFKEAIDVRSLVDHDTAKVLGRMTAGTLKLQKKPKGLFIEIDPPNTSFARDIIESISRGDVREMSFAFRVLEDEWSEDDEGFPLRELVDIRISEISPVTFPAYEATSVQVAKRSLEQFQASRRQRYEWRAKWNEIQRLGIG